MTLGTQGEKKGGGEAFLLCIFFDLFLNIRITNNYSDLFK